MLNKIKRAFIFLSMAAILCACSSNSNNTETETTSQNENSTSESIVDAQESVFIKDNIMYIREGNGNCYEYNEGIYTDDATNEEYIYSYSYFNLYAVAPEEFKSDNKEDALNEASELDDKNTEGKGVKIKLSKMNFDSAANRYYFEEDWVGQKSYYPENGIWEDYNNEGKFYVFSKNGTRIYFNSLEEITEQ